MTKRKVNRDFQSRWEVQYPFVTIGGKPACLVCGANVAVIKEYNTRWHDRTKHQDTQYSTHLDTQEKLQKAEEFKKRLASQQACLQKPNHKVKLL